ncbi:hypothetical protein BGW37DRAFT_142334 [Umbelopsis sp. PMI_123]|nr:hypothetical protein BGW37DRAFT_142334 [Umbelopsis sp. PMI_123]
MTTDSPLSRLRQFAAQHLPEALAPRDPTLKERVEQVVEQAKDQTVDAVLDAERIGSQDVKSLKRAVDNKLSDLKVDTNGQKSLNNLKRDVNAAKQHAHHAVEDAKRRAERTKQLLHHEYDGLVDGGSILDSKAKVAEQVQEVKEKLGEWWTSAKGSIDTESIKRKLEERQQEEREELFLAKGSEQHDIEDFNARALRHEHAFAQAPLLRRKHSETPESGMSLYERTQHYLDSNIERRSLGENVQYAPLSGIYGGIFLIYFLILGVRLWHQRRKTDVYVGDGTVERYRASKEEADGSKAGTGHTFEAPSAEEYEKVARLVDAFNTFTTTVPIALLLIGIMELNGYPRHLLHYILGSLVFGSALATEFGVLASDGSDLAAHGRREVGQLVMWGVMVFTGVSMVGIVWAKAFQLEQWFP